MEKIISFLVPNYGVGLGKALLTTCNILAIVVSILFLAFFCLSNYKRNAIILIKKV